MTGFYEHDTILLFPQTDDGKDIHKLSLIVVKVGNVSHSLWIK